MGKHVKNFESFSNKSITWVKIKSDCKKEVYSKLNFNNPFNEEIIMYLKYLVSKMINKDRTKSFWKEKDELIPYIIEYIDNYDIREYSNLMDIFPNVFPNFIKKGDFSIDYNEKGIMTFYKK